MPVKHTMQSLLPSGMRDDAEIVIQDSAGLQAVAQSQPSGPLEGDSPHVPDIVELVRGWMQYYDVQNIGSEYNATPQSAMKVDVVDRCVGIISGDVADLPFMVMSGYGSDARADRQHPILQLLRRPNKWQTQFDFKEFISKSLLVHGNAYIYKNRVGGQVRELQLLAPGFVTPQSVSPGVLRYIMNVKNTTGDVRKRVVQAQDMIHIRMNVTNPDVPVGESVVSRAARSIGLAVEQQKFMTALARSMGMPSGIFKQDINSPMQAQDVAGLKDQIEESRGKPNRMIIPSPGTDFQQISMTSSDIELLMSARFTRERIATHFGIPMNMLNDTTKTTSFGRGMETQNSVYFRHTLRKHLVLIQQAITLGLLHTEGLTDEYIVFDTSQIVKLDAKTQADIYAIEFQNGAVNPNEYRAEKGRDPYDGGNEFHLAPGTATPQNNEGEPAEPEVDPEEQEPQDED